MSVIETAKMNGTEPLKLLIGIASGKGVDELKRLLLGAGRFQNSIYSVHPAIYRL